MADWKEVSPAEFDDHLSKMEIEHDTLRGTLVHTGFTVWYAGQGDYRDQQWLAKRVTDSSGTYYYIAEA